MYARGENVKKYVHELTSICMALDQSNILPGHAITDILKGLLMATHVAFGILFAGFQSNLNNTLMNLSLKGTTMEQITTIFEQALNLYATASLSGEWMEVKHSALNSSAVPATFKSNNCLGNHWMGNCPDEFDDAGILKIVKPGGLHLTVVVVKVAVVVAVVVDEVVAA